MKAPEGYNKVAHRYDQFTQCEVTVWHSRCGGKYEDEPRFILDVNDKRTVPLTLGELQTVQDCVKNDLDLNKPMVFR